MKFFVVILCFVVVCSVSAVTDEQQKDADKFASDCGTENGLTPEEVQKIVTNPKSLQKDPKAKVFGKCFLGKLGFINENGEFQESIAIEHLSKGEDRKKIEEIVKQCQTVAGDNKDEVPFNLYACYIEKRANKA